MMLLPKSLAALVFAFAVSLAYPVAVFLEKPQNHTLFDRKEPFFFNCSTDIASKDGMDWVVRIKGIHERICSSKDFHDAGSSSCQLNYSMEVPNNRTLNLIVDPQIATLGDEYCCQFENGAGKKSCSYLTIAPHPVSTADPEFVDTTTVTRLDTTSASQEVHENAVSVGLIAGLAAAGVFLIGLTVALIFLIPRIRRANSRKSNESERKREQERLNNKPKDSA